MSRLERIQSGFSRMFDAGLATVAPRRAQIRQHLRMMREDTEYRESFFLGMRLRGYRAATGGKWSSITSRSADSEIIDDLAALRNRSRELERDDPIAGGAVQTFVKNVVGRGFVPQARTKDPEKNARIERVFWSVADSMFRDDAVSYFAAQRLIYGRYKIDGDVFVKPVYSPTGIAWEIIEADRVDTPPGKIGKDVRAGVEREDGRGIVRYWVAKAHPGDYVFRGKDAFEFVPVDARDMIRVAKIERPGQSRGVPFLHAVIQDLRDLDLLLLASLKRVQIAACLAVFLSGERSMNDIMSVTANTYDMTLDAEITPGMIFRTYPGETVSTLTPNFPTPELEPFVIMLCRRIGASLDLPWQMVLRDFGKSSYSSARTDILEARGGFRVEQGWLDELLLFRLWYDTLSWLKWIGHTDLQDCTDDDLRAVTHIPQGWPWVDPLKDAQAQKVLLEIGATCLRNIAAATGDDWEELQDQLIREEVRMRKKRQENGLPSIEEINPKFQQKPQQETPANA